MTSSKAFESICDENLRLPSLRQFAARYSEGTILRADLAGRLRDHNALHSGTTIVAFTYKDGVAMAADRQTSAGYHRFSTETQKIVDVSSHSVIGSAGMVGCIQETTDALKRIMRRLSGYLETQIYVDGQAKILERIIRANFIELGLLAELLGYIAVPILAGWDPEENMPKIYEYDDAGAVYEVTSQTRQFATIGSGGGRAETVLDDHWKFGMDEEDAMALAVRAVLRAGERDIATSSAERDAVTVRSIKKSGLGFLTETTSLGVAHRIFADDLRRRQDARAGFFLDEADPQTPDRDEGASS